MIAARHAGVNSRPLPRASISGVKRTLVRRAIRNVFGVPPTAVARVQPKRSPVRRRPSIDWADIDELLLRGRATRAVPRQRRKR